MTEPVLRPFRVEDLLVGNRDGEQIMTAELAEQAARGPAFTAVLDGQILGSAGIVIAWPGVGMLWMTLSPELNGNGMWLTRVVRRVIEDAVRAHRLHRLEGYALADSERNQHWMEALGFTAEKDGRATAYLSDHRDVIRYERIQLKGAD